MFLKGKQSAKTLIYSFKTKEFEGYTTTVNISEFFMGYYKTNIVVETDVQRLKDFFWTLHPRSVDFEVVHLSGKLFATVLKDQPIG